jgi:hypothetical protein
MGGLKYLLLGNIGQQWDISALEARIDELLARQRCAEETQEERIANLAMEVHDLQQCFVTLLRILQQAKLLSLSDIATLAGDLRPKRDREGEEEGGSLDR